MSEKLTKMIAVRFTEDEYKQIHQRCQAADKSVSRWMRERALLDIPEPGLLDDIAALYARS